MPDLPWNVRYLEGNLVSTTDRTASARPTSGRRRFSLVTRPAVWATLYLLAIPLYAAFYTNLLEGQFAQSNQAFEGRRFLEDRDAIGSRIKPGFESALSPGVSADVQLVGIAGALGFPVLRISDRADGASLDMWFDNGDALGDGWCAVGTPSGSFAEIIRTPGQLPGFEAAAVPYSPVAASEARTIFRRNELSGNRCDGYWVSSDGRTFVSVSLEGDAASAFFSSSQLYSSDPTFGGGAWRRMLYFSAVTITTLGFGDITPTSDWARLFVASEGVLGIVFAGLFLNALWRSRTEPGSTSRRD